MEQKKSVTATIEKNPKYAVTLVVAILVIVGGYFGYKHLYQAPREEKAQAAMFKGEAYFGQGAFNEALNGDSRGYIGFVRIIKDFSGTKTANIANYYAGISSMQLGKYQEALNYLDDFSGSDAMIAPLANVAKGDCYVELGKLDEAASAYLKAVDKSNNTVSPQALMKAALVYEKQEQKAKAAELYDQVKNDYPASYQVQSGEIDKYIERVK